MRVSVQSTTQNVTLRLNGRFDFEARRDFDQAVQQALADANRQVVVNLGEVDYMDSSALGMLLVLRDKASAVGKQVALSEMRGMVRKIIEVANFHKLFELS